MQCGVVGIIENIEILAFEFLYLNQGAKPKKPVATREANQPADPFPSLGGKAKANPIGGNLNARRNGIMM